MFSVTIRTHTYLAILLLFAMATGCSNSSNNRNPIPISSGVQRQGCTDSLGFSGKWRLVNITDSGRNIKPKTIDTLLIDECTTIARYSGGKLVKKDTFKLYRMINYCADFQLVYKNDSIGCINIIKDTLVFSECSDFETTRYFFKRI